MLLLIMPLIHIYGSTSVYLFSVAMQFSLFDEAHLHLEALAKFKSLFIVPQQAFCASDASGIMSGISQGISFE